MPCRHYDVLPLFTDAIADAAWLAATPLMPRCFARRGAHAVQEKRESAAGGCAAGSGEAAQHDAADAR